MYQPTTNGPEQLTELVATLKNQHTIKNDVVLKGEGIVYKNGQLHVLNRSTFAWDAYNITDICHNQIATKLGIPTKYYDRMLSEHPELLAYNINLWLAKDEKIKYLLRTFKGDGAKCKGIARAFLSNSFGILDNYDVLFAALGAIKEMGVNVEITKAVVTDKRMYLHVVCPEIEQQAEGFLREYLKSNDAAGNGIVSGLVITNSEVGYSRFEIRPRAVICKCNNGLVVKDDSYSRVHLGARMDEGVIEWSAETKNKNFELVMSQTKDAIKTFLSKDYLGKMISKIAEAHNIELDLPVDTLQNVCKELSITEDERRDILRYFVNDGDSKASGIFQAITRKAQEMHPDKQYDVESEAFALLPKFKKYDKPFSKN